MTDTTQWDAHLASLFRYAYRLCHHRWYAEDLVQDTLLVALEKGGSILGDETCFKSWLHTVLRNRFFEDYQKAKVRRKWAGQSNLTAWNGGESAIEAERVREGMKELPPLQLRALLLVMNDIPYAAVARMEGVPEGTIKSRVHTARCALAARV